MIYVANKYVADDTTEIDAYSQPYELECHVSVNLSDYGMKPTDENHIFVPAYKLTPAILAILLIEIFDSVTRKFTIGDYGAECWEVKLREDWRDVCVDWS